MDFFRKYFRNQYIRIHLPLLVYLIMIAIILLLDRAGMSLQFIPYYEDPRPIKFVDARQVLAIAALIMSTIGFIYSLACLWIMERTWKGWLSVGAWVLSMPVKLVGLFFILFATGIIIK